MEIKFSDPKKEIVPEKEGDGDFYYQKRKFSWKKEEGKEEAGVIRLP